MTVTVTIATEAGSRSYTGHVVCRGPGTMDMLLTEPFAMAGRSLHFPLAALESEVVHDPEPFAARVPSRIA